MPKKDLRISKDWTGYQWIDVEAKPEICTIIPTASSDTDLSIISSGHNDAKPDSVLTPSKEAPPELCQSEIENYAPFLSGTSKEDLNQKTKIQQLEDPIEAEFKIPAKQSQSQLKLDVEAEFKTCTEQPHNQSYLSGDAEPRAITIKTNTANIEDDTVHNNIDDTKETVEADNNEDEPCDRHSNESCINL